MTVTAVVVFAPTRKVGTVTDVTPRPTGTVMLSPTGLVICRAFVSAASTPSNARETTPPSVPAGTGVEEAEDGTVGGSYAHAVVRTDARDGPTGFTATASYCRCSPLGAEIAGQTPCAEHVATLWPPTRTSKPVTDGYEVCAAPGSTRSVRLPSA